MGDNHVAALLEEPAPEPDQQVPETVTTEVPVVLAPEGAKPGPRYGKRSKTERITKRHLRMYADPEDEGIDLDALRPKTRDDCIDAERPCPFVGCPHHLYLDVNEATGTVTFNFPGKEVEELEDTCALDVAARGGITLEDVGNMFNLTRERIRQIEGKALAKLKNSARACALREEAGGDDGQFRQGRYKPKYVPSLRAEVRPEPPPPPPVVSSPEPIWYVPPSEKPAMSTPAPRDEEEAFELDEPDEVEDEEDEELEDEETDDEPEAEEAEADAPAPSEEEEPMPKKNRPIKVTELTARETLVVKHYLRLAEKEGTKPSPLAIAKACKLEGSSNASISASVCTALTAAQRKGVKLPYIGEKRSRAKEVPEPVRRAPRAKKSKVPPPPVSEPALQAEVVEDVPSTAMVAVSSPDAMKNMLLVEKEKLQKKIAAIDVLLTL